MIGDSGIEAKLPLPPVPLLNGYWVQPPQPPHPRVEKAGAIQPLVTIEAVFKRYYPMGWEIQPWQPPHPRREKAQAVWELINIEAVFQRFYQHGWPIQPPQPPHPRREKAGALSVPETFAVLFIAPTQVYLVGVATTGAVAHLCATIWGNINDSETANWMAIAAPNQPWTPVVVGSGSWELIQVC
jgi:hypothetical protein